MTNAECLRPSLGTGARQETNPTITARRAEVGLVKLATGLLWVQWPSDASRRLLPPTGKASGSATMIPSKHEGSTPAKSGSQLHRQVALQQFCRQGHAADGTVAGGGLVLSRAQVDGEIGGFTRQCRFQCLSSAVLLSSSSMFGLPALLAEVRLVTLATGLAGPVWLPG